PALAVRSDRPDSGTSPGENGGYRSARRPPTGRRFVSVGAALNRHPWATTRSVPVPVPVRSTVRSTMPSTVGWAAGSAAWSAAWEMALEMALEMVRASVRALAQPCEVGLRRRAHQALADPPRVSTGCPSRCRLPSGALGCAQGRRGEIPENFGEVAS
ncbi:MAG: hypothetical protein RLY45_1360, partial [Actinomycetota bacterium]